MNSKANKIKIQFPLQLQMMRDEPVIDDSFNKVERINAPYLNEMISPVYIQNTNGVGVYDVDGNRYEIKDDYLTKNGENLFKVGNKKFVKENVTAEYSKYRDFDFTDELEAYSIWETDNNRFTIYIGPIDDPLVAYTTPEMYSDGVVVTSRLRIIDDSVYFLVYYDIDDVGYLYTLVLNKNGNIREWNEVVDWYRQTIRRNATNAMSYEVFDLENAEPIIHIGKVAENIIGISLVSEWGKAINSLENYFATYFITENNKYQLGQDALPKSETSSILVTNKYTQNFRFVSQFTNENKTFALIRKSDNSGDYYLYATDDDGQTYYKSDAVIVPLTYTPTDTNEKVVLEEGDDEEKVSIEYKIYSATARVYTATLICSCQNSDEEYAFKANGYNSNEDLTFELESEVGKSPRQISKSFPVFTGQEVPHWEWKDLQIYWKDEWSEAEDDFNRYQSIERESTDTVSAGWVVSPNVVIDDGSLYAFWCINTAYSSANNWNSQTITNGNIIEESGYIIDYTEENNKLTYTISPNEYLMVTSDYNVARSNSFISNQNLAIDTVRLCNSSATSAHTMYNNGGTAGSEATASKYLEYMNSNCTDIRYYPGSYADTSFNYFGKTKYDSNVGYQEDQPLFVVNGYRVPVHGSDRYKLGSKAVPFNILYNVTTSNTALPVGISYSEDVDKMGTLLTPWTTIDEDFYIVANSTKVIYRDKSNNYYKISIEEGNELSALLDDRYILVNTTSYWNMYDSVLMKKFHYATDYNDRVVFGQTSIPSTILAGANSSGAVTYNRYTATAINAAYSVMPQYAVSSFLLPQSIRKRILVDAEKPFRCLVEESTDTQPIDVYFSDIGATSTIYRYSIYPYRVYDRVLNFDLSGTVYNVSSTSYLSPNMFTKYISGAGNDDMVQEDYDTYVLQYYDSDPHFLYALNTRTGSKRNDYIYFFVLQGQFYAFMNNKIYSMIYNNGAISQQDAIIDCRGMKFIGNNPMIAFFWDPRSRSIYSFTGDANLAHIYNANKFTRMGYDGLETRHWYDETTQSIYADTDKGLLVLGPQNYYLFENFLNTTNCQFSNDTITHITTEIDGTRTTINLKYYESEGYEVLPIDLETSFYGLGNNEYTSIDRWDIVLYDNTGKKENSYITVGVRSITDVTVKSEEKLFKITPDMYDKWSDSILIRYVPKLQKGQGIRLYVKTPLIIQRIVPHIADMNTGTLTKRGM